MFAYLIQDLMAQITLMTLKNHIEQSEHCELWFLKVIRGNLSPKIGPQNVSWTLPIKPCQPNLSNDLLTPLPQD